jgi:ATP-dependent DNA ligase
VFSRSGYDWTEQFSQIARAAEAISARELIIDGEATVVGKTGLPDFQALRRELAKKNTDRLIYIAFDLLFLDGHDLRALPLIERKRALQEVLAKAPSKISYADFVELQDGETVFRHACGLGMEGIVSKRRDAPYRSGRQETWIKLKCTKSDTFPIVAFVEKLGARPRKIASLYVGRRHGERVLYAGKAGTGYTEKVARKRDAAAPDVPTIAEAGVRGYDVTAWQALFVPARTPSEVVRKFNADANAALAEPAIKDKLAASGYVAEGSSPEELAKLLRAEIAKWSAIIKSVGIKID